MVSTKSEPKMRVGRAKPLVESRDKTPVGSQEADAGGFPSVGRPERTLNFCSKFGIVCRSLANNPCVLTYPSSLMDGFEK